METFSDKIAQWGVGSGLQLSSLAVGLESARVVSCFPSLSTPFVSPLVHGTTGTDHGDLEPDVEKGKNGMEERWPSVS